MVTINDTAAVEEQEDIDIEMGMKMSNDIKKILEPNTPPMARICGNSNLANGMSSLSRRSGSNNSATRNGDNITVATIGTVGSVHSVQGSGQSSNGNNNNTNNGKNSNNDYDDDSGENSGVSDGSHSLVPNLCSNTKTKEYENEVGKQINRYFESHNLEHKDIK